MARRTPPDRSPKDFPAARALRRSLRRVLRERERALDNPNPGSIHDLRVALRRCRSLAEGFAELDSYGSWRRMRKSGKRMQRGLAALRDAQVMSGWARRLRLTSGPGGAALARRLDKDERDAVRTARATLDDFHTKQWKHWKRQLPKRARELSSSHAHFAEVALQRLEQARAFDLPCRRSSSRIVCHRLRVALKRFRYTVESFLPEQQAAWGRDLKALQSLLGEAHDLDVLRARLLAVMGEPSISRSIRLRWLERVDKAREERLEGYARRIVGRRRSGKSRQPQSLWERWRTELEAIAMVNRPGIGATSPSAARARRYGERRKGRDPGRRRQPSSTQ